MIYRDLEPENSLIYMKFYIQLQLNNIKGLVRKKFSDDELMLDNSDEDEQKEEEKDRNIKFARNQEENKIETHRYS
jgi:hypothetical protein